MKNNPLPRNCFAKFLWPNISLIRTKRAACLFLALGFSFCFSNTYSQSTRVTITRTNVVLEEVLSEIEKQTSYLFIYSDQIDVKQTVSVNESDKPVSEVLSAILSKLNLTYTMEGSHIVLKDKPKDEERTVKPGESKTVQGVVYDALGETVVGANIVIEGTTTGVTTDANGRYSITVPSDDARLSVSFLGYLTEDVSVRGLSEVNITLVPDLYSLEELVVVGYGVQTRASVTGSVASIRGDDVVRNRTPDVINAMTGQLPGVIINSRTGEPGRENPEILIRGRSTTGATEPLIIIDGIQRTDLSRLNSSDIESISVLKDASAAIYGSRAANGVILITTKRGQKGDPVFNLTYNQGFSQPTRFPKMADSYTFAQVYNEIEVGAGRSPQFSDEEMERYRQGTEFGYTTTDWNRTMTRTLTPQHQINLSVSGGTEALDYYISLGKMGQEGQFKNGTTAVDRYNFRSNLTVNATKYIKVGMDLSGRVDDKYYPSNPDTRGVYEHLYLYEPSWTLYWPETNHLRPLRGNHSVGLWVSDEGGYKKIFYRALESKLHATIDIPWIEGLSITGSANYDAAYNNERDWREPAFVYDYNATNNIYTRRRAGYSPENPWLSESFQQFTTVTMNAMINYSRVLDRHRIGGMVGYETMEYNYKNLGASRSDFLSPAIDQMFAGSTDKANTNYSNNGSANMDARLNYFGRTTYDYDGKYLGEFIFRRDGSPNFPKDKRWGFFPGVSLGWRISEEEFMSDLTFLSNLKLRGSYGQMGNDRVPPFQYLAAYEFYMDEDGNTYNYVIGGTDVLGMVQSVAANPNITWEVAKTYNIGIEVLLWNGLLGMELDLFKTERSNILTKRQVVVPDFSGLTSLLADENIGIVENKGFELQLLHRNRVSNNFTYSINGQVSFARNKIVFADEPPMAEDYQLLTGRPIGADLYYDAIGIYSDDSEAETLPGMRRPQAGDIIYRDVNGDGVIDANDRIRVNYTATPEIVYSLSGFVKYKNFDLSILFQGQENAKTMLINNNINNLQYLTAMTYSLGNFIAWRAEDRWTPESTEATQPRADASTTNNNSVQSTHWLFDADFLRLKNLEIGYTIPDALSGRIGIKGLRAYMSGHNLLIIKDSMKDLGFDPESISYAYYPQQRIFNIGVNLTF